MTRRSKRKPKHAQKRAKHRPPYEPDVPQHPSVEVPEHVSPVEESRKMDALEQRAVRELWPIPDDARKALVDRQVAIAESQLSEPGDATRAFGAILKAQDQNLKRELMDREPEEKKHSHSHVHLHATIKPEQRSAIVQALIAEEQAGPPGNHDFDPGDDCIDVDAASGDDP